MKKLVAIPAVLVLLASGVYAQGTAPATAPASPPASPPPPVEVKNTGTPGQAQAVRTQKVTAKVMAVDAANRSVTLQVKGHKPETLTVGPQVTRLNEVAVGDSVVVEYQEGLLLEYQPPGAEAVSPHAVVAAERAGADQAPGGVAGSGVQSTVTVTSIDMAHRLVALRGPNGNAYHVKAGPNVKLEKLKVGDKLVATYVQALAISVEKAPKK